MSEPTTSDRFRIVIYGFGLRRKVYQKRDRFHGVSGVKLVKFKVKSVESWRFFSSQNIIPPDSAISGSTNHMGCPQCQSDEISPSGVCLICGYRTAEPATRKSADDERSASGETPETASKNSQSYSGMIEIDYAEGSPETLESDIPKWRQELSQRLNEIKRKREAMGATRQEHKAASTPGPQIRPAESLSELQAKLLQRLPARKPQPPPAPPPRQKTLEPLAPESDSIGTPLKAKTRQEIQKLIDGAVSKQVAPLKTSTGVAGIPRYKPNPALNQEGKLILLSRTLSGLVDLILVVLCTGIFIMAADFFSGIVMLDRISLIYFSILFLLNYFLYSLFFLSSTNQTIGMMITDLRVAGRDEMRPTMPQILGRCCGYLISLFGLGIGLLSSLFDRESLCFHDRHSGTHVVRI